MSERENSKRTIYAGQQEIKLKCPICGCEEFYERRTLLNTAGMTYLGLDWANDEAVNYVCKDCSYIFWFENPKQKKDRDILSELEEAYKDFDEKRLRKIVGNKNFNPTAQRAACNVLKKRGIDV